MKLKLYSIQFLHQITTNKFSIFEAVRLYSIQFLHQITTYERFTKKLSWLYSIQFLHQITTILKQSDATYCCIVSNFYIKSQPQGDLQRWVQSCIVSNFYIKSQHAQTGTEPRLRCIVSNFYIKSQPQVLHLLIIRVLHSYVPRKKRCSAN